VLRAAYAPSDFRVVVSVTLTTPATYDAELATALTQIIWSALYLKAVPAS
jgi:hypothetical protein